MNDTIITETGCYLDNHRGHYIGRDAIQFAEGFGYILGSFEKFAVAMYDEHNNDSEYPHEAMIELCDEAIAWLNSGQDDCDKCGGSGKEKIHTSTDPVTIAPIFTEVICKGCSGSGRGPRVNFQNFPPKVPEWTEWRFNDGDFGLYYIESDECPVCNADGTHLSESEIIAIENNGEPWWLHNCSH